MPRYFLRIEGVNLGNVIDDTDDLSTRRGGGLMVLNAAVELKAAMNLEAEPIATGASIGLFILDEAADAEGIAEKVREHFRNDSLLRHGTFVVDVQLASDSEYIADQQLTAKNRWRQMQEPTLSLDELWVKATEPCPIDMIRPGTTEVRLPEKEVILASPSVATRRNYGRGARQKFYEREVGPSATALHFTNSIQEIGGSQTRDNVTIPANDSMKDKLAVFYVDGNKFGEKGRNIFVADGAAGFSKWSKSLQQHHRGLLKGLIELTSKDDAWRYYDSVDGVERIRLETLLWGGDEIIFIVPAWKGWELAEWFFQQAHTINGMPVTYSCGLVFCHTKAPIKNIVKLAKDKLGEAAKKAGKEVDKVSPPHCLAYEVLESIDDVTSDFGEHRSKWLPDSLKPKSEKDTDRLVFDPKILTTVLQQLRIIATTADFPMRQLYLLCKLWREGKDFSDCVKRLTADELDQPVNAVLKSFPDSKIAWLHLLQMLPYIPVEAAK